MTESNGANAGAGRGKNAYLWIVISAAFASFMSKLDTYVVNISLPTISGYFNATTAEVSRTVVIYLLVGTSTLVLFGKLGDRIGLKKVFIAGYALFTLGSLCCGLSWSINALTAFRFFQGLGGAMLLASAFALVAKLVPREMTGWAFGMLASGSALGVTFGAPLGGLINTYLSWQWVFLVNVPVGVAAIVLAAKVLPSGTRDRNSGPEGGFDLAGAFISLVGLSILFYVINDGGTAGWTSFSTIGLLLASLAILAFFVVWEKRSRNPLLHFDLLKNRDFMRANLAAFFGYMLLNGNSFMLPFYLELIKKLGTVQTGLVVTVFSALFVVLSPLAGRLSDRIRPPLMATVGMASAAVCCLVFAFNLPVPGLIATILFLVWMAFSYASFISPNNSMAMRFAPADKQGVASGMFNTVNTLGAAIGVAVMESIFSAHFEVARDAPADVLLHGFGNAYLFAALMCIVAAVLSSFNIRKAQPGRAGPVRHDIHLH